MKFVGLLDSFKILYVIISFSVSIGLLIVCYFLKYLKNINLEEYKKDFLKMLKVHEKIKEGAETYLKVQYKTIFFYSFGISLVIFILGFFTEYIDKKISVTFLLGSIFAMIAGYIGMFFSTKINIETAKSAHYSLKKAFLTAFRGGAVPSILVSLISLVVIFILVYLYGEIFPEEGVENVLYNILGFAFGASFSALFSQLGGGIYTKAADMGADLVGKINSEIEEDDSKNPGVIADLVGDNVGDCAGRGSDMFQSTAVEIICSMIIGVSVYYTVLEGGAANISFNFINFPLVLMAVGLISSVGGILCVNLKEGEEDILNSLNKGFYLSLLLMIIFLIISSSLMLGEKWYLFLFCGISGLFLGVIIRCSTQYYTSNYGPVENIVKASSKGVANNILAGIKVGFESTVVPGLAIVLVIVITYVVGSFYTDSANEKIIFGIYGTSVGAITMLSSSTFILAEDNYGPITDNAGGIVEMGGGSSEIRKITDKLDSVGNTTKALTKGYAMASASLASFMLFMVYFNKVSGILEKKLEEVFVVNVVDPLIFCGALVGGIIIFIFSSLVIGTVEKVAVKMVNEIKNQLDENPEILKGEMEPNYNKCIDIVAKNSLKEMMLPAIFPFFIVFLFGLLFKFIFPDITYKAIGSLMIGSTMVGILMANFFNNSGGAWDNAKKQIEKDKMKGKNTADHTAAVVGDIVGDPFKDTVGPSIHILIKLLPIVCLMFIKFLF